MLDVASRSQSLASLHQQSIGNQLVCCRVLPSSDIAAISQGTCRLRLTVSYDGTNFQGFQYQTPKVRTVQGELEKAAARVLLPAGRVVGASRTDAGAHATGQVAHLDVTGSPDSIQPGSLMMYMNGVLPDDVKVQHIEVAPPGFDSHYSSVGKVYAYKLASEVPDPLQSRQRWWLYDRWCERSRGKPQSSTDLHLNVSAMQEAAQHLRGVHDFTTMMDNKRPAGLGALKRKRPKLAALGIKPVRTREKNMRYIWTADVIADQSQDSAGRGYVDIHLAGNGFLYRMVRLIAAALVEVGHGRMTPPQFQKVIAAGDRSALTVEAAPPHGLYLRQVLYELPDYVDTNQLSLLGKATGSFEESEDSSGGSTDSSGGECVPANEQ